MFDTPRLLRLLLAVLLTAFFLPSCENPFDPIDKSADIRGLSYVDFALTWDRWDSDPQNDGVIVEVEFYNEFNDALSFHDKPTRIAVEFWTQGAIAPELDEEGNPVEGTGTPTNGRLLFSWPVQISNSDEQIRIPREAYEDILAAEGLLTVTDAEGVETPAQTVSLFVIVRVYPPNAQPLPQLMVFYPDQTVWQADESELAPEGEEEAGATP